MEYIVGQRVFYNMTIPVATVMDEAVDEKEMDEAVDEKEKADGNEQESEVEVGNGAVMGSEQQSSSTTLEAHVIGVHKDDFPNIYYTVLIEESGKEKQTVGSRLTPLETVEETRARQAECLRLKQEEERKELARKEELLHKRKEMAEENPHPQGGPLPPAVPSQDRANPKREKKDSNKRCTCS